MASLARTHRGLRADTRLAPAIALLAAMLAVCMPVLAADKSDQNEPAKQEQKPDNARKPSDDAEKPADDDEAGAAKDAQPADVDHPTSAPSPSLERGEGGEDKPATADKPVEAVSSDKPEKVVDDTAARNPFDIGAQLLRDVKAKQDEKNAPPAVVPVKLPELPIIKMTGVMILGDNKMATAEVESYGTITVVKGDRFVLRLKTKQEPFRFTVTEIEERQMTIVTDEGMEIRAVFK